MVEEVASRNRESFRAIASTIGQTGAAMVRRVVGMGVVKGEGTCNSRADDTVVKTPEVWTKRELRGIWVLGRGKRS